MLTRRLQRDPDAVSTVVSAVLVFTLLTIVFSIYMSQIVPEQVADEEASHMRDVASSIGDAASRISAATGLGREGEFSTLVELGTTTMPGISLFHSSGSLELQDRGFYSSFICDAPKLLARNGQAAPGGTYVPLGVGSAFAFESLLVLDVKVATYTFGGSDDTGTITVKTSGNLLATFTITLVSATEGIRITTQDQASNTVYDQILVSGLGASIPSFTINALEPGYGLASLLAESQGPFELESTATTPDLEAYALYWTDDGTLAQLGDGRLLPSSFQRTVNPISLVYRAQNKEFLDQTFSYEGGAVVLGQATGQHLTLAPFALSVTPTENFLRLSMVNLTGSGYATGSHRATVTMSVRDPGSSTLECAEPTLLISSEFPIAWHAAWSDALARAGTSETQVTLAGEVVTVRLIGTWTVILDEARVAVRIA